MPLFTLTCLDAPAALEIRLATRPSHLDYVGTFGDKVRLAGPVLNEADGTPMGSFFILDMEDRAMVEAFAEADPYHKAGVFASRDIRAFRQVIGPF